jgi:hypothetical protein
LRITKKKGRSRRSGQVQGGNAQEGQATPHRDIAPQQYYTLPQHRQAENLSSIAKISEITF